MNHARRPEHHHETFLAIADLCAYAAGERTDPPVLNSFDPEFTPDNLALVRKHYALSGGEQFRDAILPYEALVSEHGSHINHDGRQRLDYGLEMARLGVKLMIHYRH